jgi:glucan-binding YG repeat protein
MKLNSHRIAYFFCALLMLTAVLVFAEQSKEEQEAWKLESDYWKYVQAADLENYKSLWHPNFVGWPSVSAIPVRKDQITDWITDHVKNNERLQWYHIDQAGSQQTENVVVTHYWATFFWVNKEGSGEPGTVRITHTWIKTATGWQIIGGMSSPSTMPAK